MLDEYKNLELLDNAAGHRFEMKTPVGDAFIEYRKAPGRITLLHTEVDPALEGKGAASAIVEKTLAFIEASHLKLIPLCPYVVSFLKRHPEWNRIVDEPAKGRQL